MTISSLSNLLTANDMFFVFGQVVSVGVCGKVWK